MKKLFVIFITLLSVCNVYALSYIGTWQSLTDSSMLEVTPGHIELIYPDTTIEYDFVVSEDFYKDNVEYFSLDITEYYILPGSRGKRAEAKANYFFLMSYKYGFPYLSFLTERYVEKENYKQYHTAKASAIEAEKRYEAEEYKKQVKAEEAQRLANEAKQKAYNDSISKVNAERSLAEKKSNSVEQPASQTKSNNSQNMTKAQKEKLKKQEAAKKAKEKAAAKKAKEKEKAAKKRAKEKEKAAAKKAKAQAKKKKK